MKKDELKGHLSMTTANMMWGLMSPISKMVYYNTFYYCRNPGYRGCHLILDCLHFHQTGTRIFSRFVKTILRFHAGSTFQSGIVHHRTWHNLPGRCLHHHNKYSYSNNDHCCDLPERAYHKQESIGYISRCLRSFIINRK